MRALTFSVAAAVSMATAQPSWSETSDKTPLAETAKSEIGYASVAAALKGLHAKPGVEFAEQNGWIVATEPGSLTIWSFAPRENPAYPAVAKRQIVQRDGSTWVDMSIRCEAGKAACDDFVRAFEALNTQMARSLNGGAPQP